MNVRSPDRARGVYLLSLGCAKNHVDSEVLLGIVRDEGMVVVDDPGAADTLVVNTCGFIEAAKEESIEAILALARLKADSEGKRLVVAGCLSQRYPDELAQELPEVDHFLGSADMLGLRAILRGRGARLGVSALSRRAYLPDHESPRLGVGPTHTQFVKIAEGCDRPCAFCIIPKLRGPQRSRTVYSVVEEVAARVAQGAREVCLVAQDLTAYGKDLPERGSAPADIEGLLDALVEIEGLRWIRLHYAYPTGSGSGVVDRIGAQPKIASYLDVPMQHIDSGVLKKMRRGYTERSVRELVERIHAAPSRIWLRTTLLVGHPGETPEAYARLRDFVAEGHIDHLGVFPWSREEGTAAAMQPDRVEPELARERADELMTIQAENRARRHQAMVGKVSDVMIDGLSSESEWLLDGRHEGQAPEVDGKVVLCDGTASVGDIVPARIIAAGTDDLIASFDLDRLPDDHSDA